MLCEFIYPSLKKLESGFHRSQESKEHKHIALKLTMHWGLISLFELGAWQDCLEIYMHIVQNNMVILTCRSAG